MPTNPSSLQARLDAMVTDGTNFPPSTFLALSELAKQGFALYLLRQLDELGEALAERDARIASLEGTIRWALGEEGEFPERPEKVEGKIQPLYWWRSELQRRAALKGGQP